MSYYERQGWEAREAGKSRICEYRGSAGADFRRGWDACDRTKRDKESTK